MGLVLFVGITCLLIRKMIGGKWTERKVVGGGGVAAAMVKFGLVFLSIGVGEIKIKLLLMMIQTTRLKIKVKIKLLFLVVEMILYQTLEMMNKLRINFDFSFVRILVFNLLMNVYRFKCRKLFLLVVINNDFLIFF